MMTVYVPLLRLLCFLVDIITTGYPCNMFLFTTRCCACGDKRLCSIPLSHIGGEMSGRIRLRGLRLIIYADVTLLVFSRCGSIRILSAEQK